MGALSIWHILILGIIAFLLFGGRGKISDLMADVGKGVRSFRQGLSDPEPGKIAAIPDRSASSAPSPINAQPVVEDVGMAKVQTKPES